MRDSNRPNGPRLPIEAMYKLMRGDIPLIHRGVSSDEEEATIRVIRQCVHREVVGKCVERLLRTQIPDLDVFTSSDCHRCPIRGIHGTVHRAWKCTECL